MKEYERWRVLATEDEAVAQELIDIADKPQEIRDRFFSELSFGTGGLRGVIGAGTNRMNIYTVSRATNGLFDAIAAEKSGAKARFVVAYDTRKKSDVFARRTAEVLCARGAVVYLFDAPTPVPVLSFATRYLNCDAGICITASHNPAIYNGYKVYGADGGQLLSDRAAKVLEAANRYDYFTPLQAEGEGELLPAPMAVIEAYFAQLSRRKFPAPDTQLSVVYTPLNGTGLHFVPRALSGIGVTDLFLVPQQAVHDGGFPTCPRPNPEMPEALALAVQLAAQRGADLVLATDPDCDRIGIAVPDKTGEYRLFTGNETGVLLFDYLARTARKTGAMPKKPIACTTVVSTEMADPIAKAYGVALERVLTGFKYIGALINRLCAKGEEERFFFGFEESYGYLASTEVRDKDAVEAATLICAMARDCKARGMTLIDALEALYERFGYYQNELCNFEFFGEDGAKRRGEIMRSLRENPPREIAGSPIISVSDYLARVCRDRHGETVIDLPAEDMLAFTMKNETKLVIRPSGTEPKMKVYLFSRARSMEEAAEKLAAAKESVAALIGS